MAITKEEVATAVREWSEANNAVARTGLPAGWRAFELVVRGFGFRSADARDHAQWDDAAWSHGAKRWRDGLERYRQEIESLETDVVGDVGLAWGIYVEDFQHRGQPPERARVRFSQVMTKDADGWKVLLYHRDIQPFDENGQYPLVLTTGEGHG